MRCESKSTSSDDETEREHQHDYLMPGLDHGLVQSPINILSSEAKHGKHSVTLNFNGEINTVENLGHTVQLNFEPGNTITFDDKTFEFKQLHFHTPSEHLIDGMTFPMEMHVVNTLLGQKEDETPVYLVIAYLFKMGKEEPFINQFIEEIPTKEERSRTINISTLTESRMDGNQLKKELKSYYHYKGSLTTPPYTESVYWYVLSRIFEASPEQITRINEIEGDNARHIQGVYGRDVDEE
jgi:carbonic anhydrase